MRTQTGLTLPELLAVLGIVAVLSLLGNAGFERVLAGVRLHSNSNEWLHRLHEARHAALSRNRDVVLCPSLDLMQCGTSEHWQDGWLLFVNDDGDSPPHIDSDETVLAGGPAPQQLRIRANRRAFIMRPFGQRATNGTLTLCDNRNRAVARSVVVSYTGKPRISHTTASGDPIQCEAAV